jgi:hypothetical protein
MINVQNYLSTTNCTRENFAICVCGIYVKKKSAGFHRTGLSGDAGMPMPGLHSWLTVKMPMPMQLAIGTPAFTYSSRGLLSFQEEDPPRDAEQRIEPGPALQCASAPLAELNQSSTLLSYAASYWATLHLFKLRCTFLSYAALHPTELRCSLLRGVPVDTHASTVEPANMQGRHSLQI